MLRWRRGWPGVVPGGSRWAPHGARSMLKCSGIFYLYKDYLYKENFLVI